MRGNGNYNIIKEGNGNVFIYYYGNGLGMGMQSWEWEEMASKKSFPVWQDIKCFSKLHLNKLAT